MLAYAGNSYVSVLASGHFLKYAVQFLKYFFRYYLSFVAFSKMATVLIYVLFIVMNDTAVSIIFYEEQAYSLLWSLNSICIH